MDFFLPPARTEALRRKNRNLAGSFRWLWLTLVFGIATLTSGCAPVALYDWGPYEGSLQANYVTHDDAKAWADLETTITTAQKTGHRIPPGACAEYGFALYRRGQRDRAIQYFQQEAQLFPESKPLMDRLTAKVREQSTDAARPAEAGGPTP